VGQQYSPELQSESTPQVALQFSLASISEKPHLGELLSTSSPKLEEEDDVVAVVAAVVVTLVAPVFMAVVDVVATASVGIALGNVEGDLVGEAVPSMGAYTGLGVGEEVGPWVVGIDGEGGSFQHFPLWQQSPQ